MNQNDVGKGYYCEILDSCAPCCAIKRMTCVGCKYRHRVKVKPESKKEGTVSEIDFHGRLRNFLQSPLFFVKASMR